MAQGQDEEHLQPGHDNPRIAAQEFIIKDAVTDYLHALCKEGKYKEIEEFIRTCKTDLTILLVDRRGPYGYTPIHEAVANGHSQVLQLLLEYDGDPNCRANSGYTPLHLAASRGHVDCVRVLLANNADIYDDGDAGKTPIHTAALSSKHDVVKVLKSAGE